MNGIFYNITRETSKEDLSKAKAVEELIIEYSAPPEQGVRRVRATVPVGQGQCSGR